MALQTYKYESEIRLEGGGTLVRPFLGFHTYGKLNAKKDNVLWICHALTANTDPFDWWHVLCGKGKVFDPDKYFIICANILGSCYGSSGPLSVDPFTGKPYYSRFPMVTIRDMVKAHMLLREHLGIEKIAIAAGGSMGAYQVLEWSLMEPGLIERMILMNTSARESAWGIAIHTAQRLAIEADPTWKEDSPDAGAAGLKAARAIGMLTYRNYLAFRQKQTDEDDSKLDHYKASSYIHHQGDKLVKRFNAQSYHLLTRAMDSHNLARGRGKMEEVLSSISTEALVTGISSDLLCPVDEQRFLAKHLGRATFAEIDSPYGHDGFLTEGEKLGKAIGVFLKKHE